MEKIETYIRVRPFVLSDSGQGPLNSCVMVTPPHNIQLAKNKYDTREFSFDHIFAENVSQQSVCDALSLNLVTDICSGINRCILSYGMTSAGKTYTLFGEPSSALVTGASSYSYQQSDGIIPRVLQQIYQALSTKQFQAELSYIQIYNNQIYDLLGTQNNSLKIKERNGQFVVDACTYKVNSLTSAFIALQRGAQSRITATTRMNINSSRSHVLLQIKFTLSSTFSLLQFVDLAGSERVAKTQSSGDRLVEAKAINQSLSALGNVVVALRNKKQHIPFRDSTLTKILKESLSGNSKTTLICCICKQDCHFDESVSSLQFAERCGGLQTAVTINQNTQQLNDEKYTVFGRFGLQNENGCDVGFVRCRCPVCQCELTVLDDEFADDISVGKEHEEHSLQVEQDVAPMVDIKQNLFADGKQIDEQAYDIGESYFEQLKAKEKKDFKELQSSYQIMQKLGPQNGPKIIRTSRDNYPKVVIGRKYYE